jgi:hypothetical protein
VNHYAEEVKAPRVKKEKPTAVAPPLNTKKLVTAVMKMLCRVGRPRKVYATARGEKPSCSDEDEAGTTSSSSAAVIAEGVAQVPSARHALLLTWEALLKEVCMEYSSRALVSSVVTLELVQDITAAVLAARKAGPCRDPKLKIPTFDHTTHPLLADNEVHPKLVVECCDRMDTVHRLRCALAFLGDTQFEAALQDCNRVPGMGPGCPAFQRDNSLPVWWSYAHDVRLVRAALSSGHSFSVAAWKKFQGAHQTLTQPPDDFELPPREKVDWVMELTPKVAEKRLVLIGKVHLTCVSDDDADTENTRHLPIPRSQSHPHIVPTSTLICFLRFPMCLFSTPLTLPLTPSLTLPPL